MKSQIKQLVIFSLLVTLMSCQKQKREIVFMPNEYHNAVDKITSIMVHDILSPPVASRIYTYSNIADFDKTISAYTKTSIAIADAFISCRDEKYRSNLIHPETLINQHHDENWTPVSQTPPFAEYTSGHSVVSETAAVVLTDIFGDDTELKTVARYNLFKTAVKFTTIICY